MPGFLDDYEPVEDRLAKFWDDWPTGQIVTEMLPAPEGQFIVKASVWRETLRMIFGKALAKNDPSQYLLFGLPDATGLAHEHVTEKGVNSTSALENCETSAIGRALANLGYAAKGKRPSREEMAKTKAGGEPSRPAHVAWLADQVKIFKAWSEDGRRDAYTQAMVYLGYEELDDQKKAEAVFNNMKSQYDEQAQLPIEGETK